MIKSYIITETSLGAQCAEILLARKHQVLGIITNNKNVIQWSREHNISYFLSFKEFEDIKPFKTFDYLFSIVNGKILSKRILEYPIYHAINYHDAPLPQYAGIHATSWAILNNEKTHGISWHVMNPEIDKGDILEQNIFPIEANDTALMLNLKCVTQAIESFKLLLKNLEYQTIQKQPQDFKNRSYYGYHQKPKNSGLVDWDASAEDIDRIFRALHFGNYSNKLASFKMLINQEIFFPHILQIQNRKTETKPGKLIKIDDNGLIISTQTSDILVNDITNSKGDLCTLSHLENDFNLHEGYQFPIISTKVREDLYQSLTTISPCEKYWKNKFLHAIPAKLPLNSSSKKFESRRENQPEKAYKFIAIQMDKNLRKNFCKKFEEISFLDLLLGTFIIYLSRLQDKSLFTIDYADSFVRNLTRQLDSFLSSEIFLTINLPKILTGKEAIQRCIEEKSESLKNKTYSLDIKERYPSLKEQYYDRPDIKINIIELEERLKEKEIEHLLEICLDPKGEGYALIFFNGFNETEQYLINSIPEHINCLLENLMQDPNCSIQDLVFLASKEEKKVLFEWNNTEKQYPYNITLQQLFEESVEKNSNSIAIVCDETELTYKELNEKVNQLAHYIKERNKIKPDTLIVLCLDRSEYQLISLLSVLKVGGAYVPIDPNYPDDRISFILHDTSTNLILTNTIYKEKLEKICKDLESTLEDTKFEILDLDNQKLQGELTLQPSTNLEIITSVTDLAYVIYTSGTTGRPKGVMIEHRNIVNLILAIKEVLEVSEKDNFLFYRSYAFDGVIEETILPIIIGAKLTICTSGLSDLSKFFSIIRDNKISIININSETAQVLGSYTDEKFNLRKVIAGGTKLNLKSFSSYLEKDIIIFNSYGPTECTVDSTYFVVDPFSKNNWIGKPIFNYTCYVLDSNLKPSPISVIGELYIGGAGVGSGYLNQIKLTKEKFIPNPFQTQQEKNNIFFGKDGSNSRLYKTGDLVRWLPDGNLEYIGRKDFQVKIRGYRIELGEIENVLLNYKDIKQCIVTVKDRASGDKCLVGYYVSEEALNEENILSYLQDKLPEYMIPSILVHLTQLPLTINGKINLGALPEPQFSNTKAYISPRNKIEEQLVKIWAEVLGLSKSTVGIEDDFFRLGGDSIVSIQIISRLRKKSGLVVSIKDIFSYKTIKKLYENVLSKKQGRVKVKTEQGLLCGEATLLPIQKWFFRSNFEYPNYWNQSFIIKVPNLDIDQFRKSVNRLINHHDAFRLRYRKNKKKETLYSQFYDDKVSTSDIKILNIETLNEDLREVRLYKILSNWQSEFDLEKGPLHCIGYLYGYEDGSTRIFFALHHLIVDTVSWRILVEDLRDIYYEQFVNIKGSSYRQWAQAVDEYASKHQEEKNYWNKIISEYKESSGFRGLEELIDKETGEHLNFSLSKEQTQKLLTKANQAYNTQINDILLTALGYALKTLTKSSVNYIVLEGHGREEIAQDIDITKTVGWFTIMYPVRLEIKEDIGEDIKHVKETLRHIPNKGIGYGTIIGYNNKDLPRISFNYLGQFDYRGENKQIETSWKITAERAGAWIHKSNSFYDIINITGLVDKECIHFKIISKLNRKAVEILKNQFKLNLENIILHTVKQERTYLTASDVSNIVCQRYLDKIQEKNEVISIYKANSLQQGFIYHFLKQGDIDDAYIVQMIWKYRGPLDIEALKKSWQLAQNKYPALRSRLRWDEELVQIIDKKGKLDWRYIDFSKTVDDKKQEQQIKQVQKKDREEKYNLKESSLFRVYIIKQRANLYTCIFSYHHVILDGWSCPLLFNYIHNTYTRFFTNEVIDTIVDQSYSKVQEYKQNTRGEHDDYWQTKVAKIEGYLDLSELLKTSNVNKQLRISEHRYITDPKQEILVVEGDLYKNLKRLNQKKGITLNAILQYVWHLILRLYGSKNDESITTVVGTIISGRESPIEGIENSIGLYINTLPLIIKHYTDQDELIIDAIKRVQDEITEINSKSNTNLSKLQKDGVRLFESLFVYENYPNLTIDKERNSFKNDIENHGCDTSKIGSELKIEFKEVIGKLDYPLAVVVHEEKESLILNLRYAGELFTKETIKKLLNIMNVILKQVGEISTNQNCKVKDLIYLDKDEEKLVIKKWNDTNALYPETKTINTLFEEQAEKTPNNIAVIDSDNKKNYTYNILLTESNALANYIISHNKNHEVQVVGQLIGILAEKGYNQVLCALSIMKSGGCYLPLNIEWPSSKLDEILIEGAVATLFISQNQYKNQDLVAFLSKKYNLLVIEEILQNLRDANYFIPASINLPIVNSDDIAYVIFTSGSTGKPKGVTIQHKGAINTIHAINLEFRVGQTDKVLAISEFSFDLSVYDIFGMLFVGGAIVFPQQSQMKNVDQWWNLINQHQITIWNTVPQLANLLINNLSTTNRLNGGIRLFLLSGDYVPKQLPNVLMFYIKTAIVVSLGGATEGSIWSIWYKIDKKQAWKKVPYGFPMPNQRMYVLNSHQQFCPIGVIGEIYIGGIGVALKYWNNEKKTQESFIDNSQLGKIYKTGDLGRWNKSGYIEYIGRSDFQVKIRGFRIELGEIESVLGSYPGIKQNVVLAKERKIGINEKDIENDKYLVAYYTSTSGEELDEANLFSFLSNKLPDYMVPGAIIHLDKLPLTINGKLDRQALPDPKFGSINNNYLAPRDELESKICRIFAEVLNLNLYTVGVRDNFFRLGGNSILAITLVNKINREIGVQIDIASIFTYKNVENLAHNIKSSKAQNILIKKINVLKKEHQLLSFAQERLWFIEKYEEGTNAYNIPIITKIADYVSLNLLKKTVDSIIERHEILRTLIKEDKEGNSYQLVTDLQPNYAKEVRVDSTTELNEELTKDANHIFKLNNEYPIKATIYRLSASENYLSVVIHHIACDGWSIGIFLKELEEYYKYYKNQGELIEAEKINLPELTIQYKDFALWQRNYLTGYIFDTQISYWKNKLSGYENINLITDYIRPLEIYYEGNNIYFELDENLSMRLRRVAKGLDVSLYSLLLSAYFLILKSYTNQNYIVIGTPAANRHYPQIEHLIGFFVNTLAIRVNINDYSTLKEFIKHVGNQVIESQLHQDLPFEKLVEELGIEKDTSKHPVFQVMFGVQRFDNMSSKGNEKRVITPISGSKYYNIAKFDLETFIDDSNDILKGSFNYRISLYKEETIKRFISTYIEILKQIGELLYKEDQEREQKLENEVKLKDIKYLSDQEYDLVVYKWNSTDSSFPDNETIPSLFEKQVERTPDNIAVIYKDITLTYRELNEKANSLAHYLVKKCGIKPEDSVVLFLDRNEKVIISIFASLKAGGAYVPIDPEYPDERIKYILQNTKAKVILTNLMYENKIRKLNIDSDVTIATIDSSKYHEIDRSYKNTNIKIPGLTSSNLAYIIYTSGTTGESKGVMVEHRSAVNLAIMQGKEFGISTIDRDTSSKDIKNCLCYANYVFDANVSEVLTAILSGNKLYLLSNDERFNFDVLDKYIKNNNINIATIPPAMLSQKNHCFSLNTLIVAGEKINNKIFHYYLQNNTKVINAYGPTEATVCSSLHNYEENDIVSNIGAPLSNTKAYVLSPLTLNPLPIGSIGELYIGGIGLARGYLNNSALTNEKFIPNPFQTEEERKDINYGLEGRNSRIYKTGDLVRWLPNGNLDYIGRNDFQVKIRGHRIELGEIETVLASYPEIKQCVVLALEQRKVDDSEVTNKRLVAYYVSNSGEELEEDKLLSYISSKLPTYMVPSNFVYLNQLPVTVNGKLNRKALPNVGFGNNIDNYVPPRNELESKICSIFAEVLGLNANNMGIRNDFFRMGGDSIISIQLINRLRQDPSLSYISIKDIFNYRTVEKLYENIIKVTIKDNTRERAITEQGVLCGVVPLLPIQQWFFENKFINPHHWNQSFIIKTPELNLEILTASIKALIGHHDVLKMKYTSEGIQYYDNKSIMPELKILDMNTLTSDRELFSNFTSWQSNFNLQTGPLYAIGYIYGFKDRSARIFFALHHLIVDAVSWRILTEDLKKLYYDASQKGVASLSLELKGSSYRQWVNTVNAYKDNHESEKIYWNNIIFDIEESNKRLELSLKKKKAFSKFVLTKEQTNKLLTASSRAYNTEINDLLLTALSLSLSETLGRKVNHITLEGHGREENISNGLVDISRTIGWFTTMYPVRLEVRDDNIDKVSCTIKYTKELLRQIPNKGIGYGALIGYNNKKLPKISFNYFGQLDQEKIIKGRSKESNEQAWKIVDEASGISINSEDHYNFISINGFVSEGSLKFNITTKLGAQKTKSLTKSFKKNIENVVSHCIYKNISEYNPSDFKDFDPYISFYKTEQINNQNILFLFPPGEGGAESYLQNTILELQDINLIVFNNYYRFLQEKKEINFIRDTTYEKLASYYIAYIKSIQPTGPYNLFGWSFGGVLAFEVARQLIIGGDEIENIFIVDSLFNFKTALVKTNIKLTNSINYKYSPQHLEMRNTKIHLFKAGKLMNEKEAPADLYKIFKYYVEETECNHIESIIDKQTNLSIEKLNSTHYNWINNLEEAKKVYNTILSVMKRNI